ncbi:MAG: MFS transporter [Chloroflexi bacterium]|nr:MFS transporter [Chloroflexota bacterium]
MQNLSTPRLFAINAYWIGLAFMWNSLHGLILPAVLLHLAPDEYKNTALGLLTMSGLLIAVFVQPLSGALSDRWRSRWGRRRPLILLGTLFDFFFLALLGWAGGLGWLALGYLGLQVSSNIAHGPLQGLLPDLAPRGQLGRASGVKNLMDMGGLIAASLLMGRLLRPEDQHPIMETALITAVLAAGAAITLLAGRERPSASGAAAAAQRAPSAPFYRPYAWLIASRFCFLAGIYGIQAFAQYYVMDVLAAPNPIRLTGDLLATITLALVAFALAGGWLGDRFGHRRLHWIACAIGALGCILMLWARTPQTLLIFGSVLGVGIGLFLTANWALANSMAPPAEAGRYLGLTNLATAGAGVLARLEGPAIDYLNHARPGAWWGYTMLFLLGVAGMAACAWTLTKAGDRARESKEAV